MPTVTDATISAFTAAINIPPNNGVLSGRGYTFSYPGGSYINVLDAYIAGGFYVWFGTWSLPTPAVGSHGAILLSANGTIWGEFIAYPDTPPSHDSVFMGNPNWTLCIPCVDSPPPERLPDLPYANALPMDTRYRDLCISGAALPPDAFDPLTGVLATFDAATGTMTGMQKNGTGTAACNEASDEMCTGTMLGAKSQLSADGMSQCVPMRDTPWIDVTAYDTNPNLAFSYFLNTDDDPNYNLARLLAPLGALAGGLAAPNPTDVYGNSNFYRNSTFFIGSPPTGCTDILTYNGFPLIPAAAPISTAQRADFWRAKADYCTASFILNHDVAPVVEGLPDSYPENLPGTATVMERPGVPNDPASPEALPFGTADPLSQINPSFAIINSCQPLVSGDWADIAQLGGWNRADGGGAPVWRYTGRDISNLTGISVADGEVAAAYMDEDEYLLSGALTNAWQDYFISAPTKNPAINTPIANPNSSQYTLAEALPDNPFSIMTCFAACAPPIELPCVYEIPSDSPPESAAESTPDSPSYIPPQCPYTPPTTAGSCPMPYPYLNLYWQYLTGGYQPANRATAWCPNVEKILDPTNPFSPRTAFTTNDRDKYSPQTETQQCGTAAYTDYNDDPQSWAALNEFPVQCAIVPVDIMDARSQAFDSCMSQRIAFNMEAFINYTNANGAAPPPQTAKDAQVGPGGSVTSPITYSNGDFRPPCATRFWEQDTIDGCPTKMSIQQCCHIIVKDLVPANYLKLRTCEGLRQNRISHLGAANITDNQYASNGDETGANVYISEQNYQAALADDETLSKYGCNGSSPADTQFIPAKEPPEYLFNYWFGGQAGSQINNQINNEINYQTTGTSVNLPLPGQPPCAAAYPKNPNASYTPYCDFSSGTPVLVGYHMPYMRWWDTGVSAGNPRHGGSFLNTLGGYDTLVGVGREERIASDAASAAGPETQTAAELAVPQPAQMGRVGGWTELKEHELWTIRRSNLFCIGRYEKLFKPGGPEGFVLGKAGSIYSTIGNTAVNIPSAWQQWPLGWRGYATDTNKQQFPAGFDRDTGIFGFQKFTLQGLGSAQAGDIIVYTIGGRIDPVSGVIIPGLAQIAYVTGVHLTTVTDSNTGWPTKAVDGVTVVDWDQGKFPTSTGSTATLFGNSGGAGAKTGRTIWQTAVPPQNQMIDPATGLARIDPVTGLPYQYAALIPPGFPTSGQPSCEDPDFPNCVLPFVPDSDGNMVDQWNVVSIYRPSNNADVNNVLPCVVPDNWDNFIPTPPAPSQPVFPGGAMEGYLKDTYSWQGTAVQTIALRFGVLGNQGVGASLLALPTRYIYQGQSQSYPSNAWSFCVNSGYDPPPSWGSQGAGLDALTPTTLCGQAWRNLSDNSTGCRADSNTVWFFPPPLGASPR